MLDSGTKRRIDTARDILVGKVPDPKSQVEQITIALIYKFMDDMDAEAEELGGKRKFFTGAFARYGWAKLMRSGLGGHETLNLYGEGIAKMPENPGIPLLFRDIFKNAYLPYRDPETLRAFLKIIDEFSYDHSERLGDAFEYLLSVLGSQGDAGQFRTPRHIIDFIVHVVDPKKDESVLDPACGTAGFLISSYKHILKANTDKKGHSTLTPDEKAQLARNFKGYDISPDMVRLSLANLYLHGFHDPHIHEYDTLTSQDRWSDYAGVILANPPFMSPKGGIKPHNRFSVQSKRSEVLFVDYMAEHLTPTGRAGIIVPEGVIFQSGTAYKQLRKMLVEEYLVAVISLPAGVFNPYSGVKTSILVLDRALAKKADTLAFFKVENDGYGLGAQRREIEKNDLPQVQAGLAEYLHRLRAGESLEDFQPALGLIVAKEKIAANGDCNLSGERYREGNERSSQYPWVELREIILGKPQYGSGASKVKYNGDVRYIRITDLTNRGELKEANPVSPSTIEEDCFLQYGDLLVARSGSVGRTYLHQEKSGNFQYAGYLIRFKIDTEKANPAFVFQVTQSPHWSEWIAQQSKTGTITNINAKQYSSFRLPLPPLEVQKEIVAEIEGYQKVIDGARAVLDNYRPHIPLNWNPPPVDVHSRLVSALKKFRDRDGKLMELNCNERAMTAKIACYLQEQFPEWDVDHEYNREGKDPKRSMAGTLTTPDIIVHRRDTKENFAVIEVKKSGGIENEQRLIELAKHRKYDYAFIVVIDGELDTDNWIESLPQPELRGAAAVQGEWPMVEIGSISTIVRGSSPRPQGDPKFFGGPVPRLMVADITRDGMYATPQIDSLTILGATKSRPMRKGEVVITVSGNPGLPTILATDACIHDGFVGLRELSKDVLPTYLYFALLALHASHGAQSVGAVFKNLTTDQIREFKIVLPPLATQRAIVAEIEAEQALVAANRELITRFEQKIQATLARVWGGDAPAPAEA